MPEPEHNPKPSEASGAMLGPDPSDDDRAWSDTPNPPSTLRRVGSDLWRNWYDR